jgi:hypothetical protein
MMYFEYRGAGSQHHIGYAWGPCRRLVEVHDDQSAVRQIDLYDNGLVLKYDRDHARDEYGMLIGFRFSRKQKWRKGFPSVRMMSKMEFDRVWNRTSTTHRAEAIPGEQTR